MHNNALEKKVYVNLDWQHLLRGGKNIENFGTPHLSCQKILNLSYRKIPNLSKFWAQFDTVSKSFGTVMIWKINFFGILVHTDIPKKFDISVYIGIYQSISILRVFSISVSCRKYSKKIRYETVQHGTVYKFFGMK